jgi:hypothetical protein
MPKVLGIRKITGTEALWHWKHPTIRNVGQSFKLLVLAGEVEMREELASLRSHS